MKYFFKFEGHELRIILISQIIIMALIVWLILIYDSRPVDVYFDEVVLEKVIKKQIKNVHCPTCHN